MVTTKLLRSLERRFPHWEDRAHRQPAGIIALGGGLNDFLRAHQERGGRDQGPGQRVATALALAKLFPDATVIIAGEAHASDEPRLTAAFIAAGVDPKRVLIETLSQNTAENAAFAFRLLQPQPGQRWILVTSAYHMPRAVGCFRAVGFEVEACPVDYLRSDDRHSSVRAWRELVALLGSLRSSAGGQG